LDRFEDELSKIKLNIKDWIFKSVKDKDRLARFVKARIRITEEGHESLAVIYKDPIEVDFWMGSEEINVFKLNYEIRPGELITFKMKPKHEGDLDSKDEIWDKYINTAEQIALPLLLEKKIIIFKLKEHILNICKNELILDSAFVHVLPDSKEIWDVKFKYIPKPGEVINVDF